MPEPPWVPIQDIDPGRSVAQPHLINHGSGSVAKIACGDRIAQLVVQRVNRAHFDTVDRLPDASRGAGGPGWNGGYAGSAADER